jgi:hypothetical protein
MSTMDPDEGTEPDDQRADAPRWEKTEAANATDAPRWEGAEAPDATDAPRWEGAEGADAPRWEGADPNAEASDSDDPGSTDQ